MPKPRTCGADSVEAGAFSAPAKTKEQLMSDNDPYNDPDNWNEWGYIPNQREEPMSEEDDED